ncbi:MAG TPA: hypothetical protein EYP08_05075, partial [Pyrodictiaceae archaeon]|nr:hypothetical protein [Pyrodictiaceae archaeon]
MLKREKLERELRERETMAKRPKVFYLWITFLLILTAMYIYSALELLALSNTFPQITLFDMTIDLNAVIKKYLFVPPPHTTVYVSFGVSNAMAAFTCSVTTLTEEGFEGYTYLLAYSPLIPVLHT